MWHSKHMCINHSAVKYLDPDPCLIAFCQISKLLSSFQKDKGKQFSGKDSEFQELAAFAAKKAGM